MTSTKTKNFLFIYSFIIIILFTSNYYFYNLYLKSQIKLDLLSEKDFNQIFQFGTFALLFLILFIIMITQYIYSKKVRSKDIEMKSRYELEVINSLFTHLQQFNNVKDISHYSLQFLQKLIGVQRAKFYIVDYVNEQLYLSGTFNIDIKEEEKTLEIYRGQIGESVAFQKVKYIQTKTYYKISIPLISNKKVIASIILYLNKDTQNYKLSDFHHNILNIITDFLQKELKNEENEKYFNLIDNYIITSTTNKDGKITYVSKAFQRIHGYREEELLGKSHNILRSPNIKDEVFKKMWNTIKKGQVWNSDIQNSKKNNTNCWLNTTIQPNMDYYNNIIGYTAIRVDITDKKAVEKLSITDSMTKVYNRRYFDEIFPQQLKLSKRLNQPIAFCMIDIDHFKQYNDTYGHQAGDLALMKVSQSIKQSLKREEDLIFRLGGEEFGFLCFTKNNQDAYKIATTIKNNIENTHIPHKNNSASEYITVSIGLYIYDFQQEQITAEEIYLKADTLLYKSKQNGRNQVSI